MCGIAGIFSRDQAPVDPQILSAMISSLHHRGPDGEGTAILGSAAIGHRRLSIIDPLLGIQPMWSGGRTSFVSFNGEIFNYRELRNELVQGGAEFRTTSDTEVLLEGMSRFGVDFLPRMNGQFAFAYYQQVGDELLLVRDRMGEKPLYYAEVGHQLLFGSEMKAILTALQMLGGRAVLDRHALNDFLSLNYVPGDQTLVSGIRKLPPGHFLRVNSRELAIHRYWSPHNRNIVPRSLAQASEELEHLLRDSIRLRLRSDVPVGIFLSGGIDSTLVGVFSERGSGKDQLSKAFSAGFSFSNFDESRYAAVVAGKLDLPFESFAIAPESNSFGELLEALVFHGDEPLADSSAIAVYLLSREVAKQRKVVLSGDGGDELFGGYLTYRATELASRIPKALRQLLVYSEGLWRSLAGRSKGKVGPFEKLERFARSMSLPPGAAHFAWNGMLHREAKMRILREDFRAGGEVQDTFLALQRIHGLDSARPSLPQLQLADQLDYLPNDILAKVDRMTMAHGLEARPIFLDHRIVDFANALPESLRIKSSRKASDSKYLLREILRRSAPWYDSLAPKQGFSVPVHKWFRTLLWERTEELFTSSEIISNSPFSQTELLQMWREHCDGKRSCGFELWGIVSLLLWMKKFRISVS